MDKVAKAELIRINIIIVASVFVCALVPLVQVCSPYSWFMFLRLFANMISASGKV
jgi:hypothetical protein